MSYVIDVYRNTTKTHDHFLSFATYVTLFPHQISGPLVRHNTIVPQLENNSTYLWNPENFWKGLCFFILGISKKIIIADRIAVAIDPLISQLGVISNTEAWLCMLGYTMQLYFDFSGYSDMAVGLGYMMNIQFPQNFNSPYKSNSITEFWQRWHISLSSWLKDYLYISLGGNRKGHFITYRNLFLTMAIGGLWHGAHWVFIIWGAYHGCLLIIERFIRQIKTPKMSLKYILWIYTFLAINIGWVFFRSPSLKDAFLWLQKIFFLNNDITYHTLHFAEKNRDRFALAMILAMGITLYSKNTWEIDLKPRWSLVLGLVILFIATLSYLGSESPFLYFQF